MNETHWIIEAVRELANDARKDDNPGILLGLTHVIDTFCDEAGLTKLQRSQVAKLMSFEKQCDQGFTVSE